MADHVGCKAAVPGADRRVATLGDNRGLGRAVAKCCDVMPCPAHRAVSRRGPAWKRQATIAARPGAGARIVRYRTRRRIAAALQVTGSTSLTSAKAGPDALLNHSRGHWGIADPSSVEGSDAERLAAFRRARDELGDRVRELILAAERDPASAASSRLGDD
jgi:hypothetical protein